MRLGQQGSHIPDLATVPRFDRAQGTEQDRPMPGTKQMGQQLWSLLSTAATQSTTRVLQRAPLCAPSNSTLQRTVHTCSTDRGRQTMSHRTAHTDAVQATPGTM